MDSPYNEFLVWLDQVIMAEAPYTFARVYVFMNGET